MPRHYPDHGILGEEAPDATQLDLPYLLGGRSARRHDQLCPRLSLLWRLIGRGPPRDGLLAGVVYDPERDECFSAAAGEGARLNGQPIAVSRVTLVEEALVAVSFPAIVTEDAPDVRAFLNVAPLLPGGPADRLGGPESRLCRLRAARRPLGPPDQSLGFRGRRAAGPGGRRHGHR